MNIQSLLDQAKARQELATDKALAEALGVTKQAVSNWRHGTKTPDPVACGKLAVLSGEPLARVLGLVGEARAISREEKAVWRRLGAAAAIVLATGIAALPFPAAAAYPTNGHADRCIMRT